MISESPAMITRVPSEREIEAAGRRLDWTRTSAQIHEDRCYTRNRASCVKCDELLADEFAAQSRYDALVLRKAGARLSFSPDIGANHAAFRLGQVEHTASVAT